MILGKLPKEKFIRQYWQQKALLIPAAYPQAGTLIGPQDLLAMACAAECESRLVLWNGQRKRWQSEQGPFTAKRLKQLPATGWTILVQAVDQWIPEVAALLQEFDFLPRWRLDDIMISFARDGGGVGPHFDYYDVFLLQASGQRRWQIGQPCDETSPLRPQSDLRLLKQFETKQDHLLQTGDMLYIPAGLAHWGTAVGDDCITISIGFRAASQRELIQLALEKLASHGADHVRYRDTEDGIDADPYCINQAALRNLQQLWQAVSEQEREQAFAQALGIQATEPRYPEHIEPPAKRMSAKALWARIQREGTLPLLHPAACRFAYRPLAKHRAELYVNGECYETSLALAKGICHGKVIPKTESEMALLLLLLNQGCLQMSTAVRR